MAGALESIIQSAAGTGAPTKPTSRYYGSTVEMFIGPDGVEVIAA